LPDDHNSRPEIDVMEILGHEPNEVHFHLHNNDIDPGETWSGLDLSEDWHTFAVDWQPDALIWYVDGIERWRYSDNQNIPISPSYLLLNLAVGGYWPGSPDASTPFPSDFEIDYMRVWQIGENASSDDVIYALTVNNINDCASNPNKILSNTVTTFTFDDTNPPRPPVNFHIVSN
jgi:beta-glucanase (GH16 family)